MCIFDGCLKNFLFLTVDGKMFKPCLTDDGEPHKDPRI